VRRARPLAPPLIGTNTLPDFA